MQRILRHKVDVVRNHHQITNRKSRIHATGRIAYKKSPDAKFVHHPYRKCHLLHRVTLIVVETTLHRHNIPAAQASENELPGMPLHRRNREVRNISVRDADKFLNAFGQLAQFPEQSPSAEH